MGCFWPDSKQQHGDQTFNISYQNIEHAGIEAYDGHRMQNGKRKTLRCKMKQIATQPGTEGLADLMGLLLNKQPIGRPEADLKCVGGRGGNPPPRNWRSLGMRGWTPPEFCFVKQWYLIGWESTSVFPVLILGK